MSGGDVSGGFPGLLSQFDVSSFGTGLGQSEAAMANRYTQLGLGGVGATPTSPGATGLGTTAEQMDLGARPSLTGGIPAEFAAGAGSVQTGDIGQTLALALNNLQTSAGNKGNLLTNAGNIFGGNK